MFSLCSEYRSECRSEYQAAAPPDRIGSGRRNPSQSNICLLKVAGKENKSKHPFEKFLDTEQMFVI